jgi:hypothetical protein
MKKFMSAAEVMGKIFTYLLLGAALFQLGSMAYWMITYPGVAR